MLKMDSSSSSLSSDWDIVGSTSVITEESIEESPNETAPNEWASEKECPACGSGVDDINDADVIDQNDADVIHQNDSNSSSDIDVIEETAEDLMRMSIPSLEYSMNSSLSVGSLMTSSSSSPAPHRDEFCFHYNLFRDMFLFIRRQMRNPQFPLYLAVIFIATAVVSTVLYPSTPRITIKEMKEQVDELKKENSFLRSHVISSKLEDDKLLLTLEEQINALKIENRKLGNSLQSLIAQMEEQTAVFKKENEMRHKDPYKSEIDKLKEQVNLLEIDNEELQKQLVRMRYGAYMHNSENTKDGKEDVEPDKNENPNVFTEDIEKLKAKLYSEVDDLKEWKDAVTNLIRRLNENEKNDQENKDNFENRKYNKEEKNERTNKEQKWSDWSWKDLKRNFKDTFDSINVSDMFPKVDEKKVKGYFDSVNHYFKKAQEKTKKILNFNENGKDEVWNFLGDLRKKWANMRNEFFKSHHKSGPVPPNSDRKGREREHASSFTDKPRQFESEERKKSNHFKTKDQQLKNEQTSRNNLKNNQIPTLESMVNDPKLKQIMENRYGPSWVEEMKKYIEEQNFNDIANENEQVRDDKSPNEKEQAEKPEGSWMFNRAAIRSVLRERDEQEEDSTNWYLRRKNTAKGETGFSEDL